MSEGNCEKRFRTEYLDLRLGDCMNGMKEFPDNHFDLAIVDPEYGIGISNNPFRQKHDKKQWDSLIPDHIYFAELERVSKNQIIWGGNYFPLAPSQGFLIWDKKQPQEFSSAMCEFAWMSFQSPAKMFRLHVVTAEKAKIHPTQKPVKLYKWLLKNYSEPGQKILDTHLGSMSIAIACHDYKCYLTGFEIDEDYFREGTKRVQNHVNQLQLFR